MDRRQAMAPLSRREYHAARQVWDETKRDLDYVRWEGMPTEEAVQEMSELLAVLGAAIVEYENRRRIARWSRRWSNRFVAPRLDEILGMYRRRFDRVARVSGNRGRR